MNNTVRILLLVGGLILALLIGIIIGRGQRAQPVAEGNAAGSVQITTAAPPAPVEPAPLPLPAPIQAAPPPPSVAVAPPPKIAPDLQVQEDAAAVGMTTREEDAAANGGAPEGQADQAPPY